MNASKLLVSFLAIALGLGCSDNAPAGPSPNPATGGSSGAGGNSSVVPGTGGGGSGPAPSGGTSSAGTTSGSAGTSPAASGSGGVAGSGGSAGGSGGTASGEEPTNFTCTQVIGAMITGEWFNGGNFEDKLEALGGDGDKWEIKNEHYGTIEKWANPTEEAHANDHLYWGHAVGSACAMNSNNPDRVIFTAISWELTTEEQWKTALEAVVANIKAKYSNIRWIELTSQIRCPNNMMCNENAVQGPGSDTQASLQDRYVWPAHDAAMAAVAAADPIVGLTPQFEAATCRPEGIDGAHLGSANNGVAQGVAEHYAEHP
jgi:hypothetical protein